MKKLISMAVAIMMLVSTTVTANSIDVMSGNYLATASIDESKRERAQ